MRREGEDIGFRRRLDDIANTRGIRGVAVGGRWLSDQDIRKGLDELAAARPQ